VAVHTEPELLEQIARYKPGDHVAIGYRRDGKDYATTVELKNSAGTTSIVKEGMGGKLLGATVRPLTNDEKSSLGVQAGLMVTDPGNGTLARKTSMRKNFIITSVNDQPVASIADLQQSIAVSSGRVQLAGFYPGYKGIYYYALTDLGPDSEQ